MKSSITSPTLEQKFSVVKSTISSSETSSSSTMIHHKVPVPRNVKEKIVYRGRIDKRYGVSPAYRVLSKSLLIKKFDHVRDCLEYVLGLSIAQRNVILGLLRLWAYYGQVYPKEAQVTAEPGCSKATFWRTIKLLEDEGLLTRINRFVIRPHAQISNLYRLDKLVQLIAKYLAEHIGHIWPDWLKPILNLTWPELWEKLDQSPEARAGPMMA